MYIHNPKVYIQPCYHKNYYQVNKEKLKAQRLEYYYNNKEKVKAITKAYREANKEKIYAINKKDPEKIESGLKDFLNTKESEKGEPLTENEIKNFEKDFEISDVLRALFKTTN